MIALNEFGFLPSGIHEMSLKEIEELFGRFQETDQRPTLFKRLTDLINQMKDVDLIRYIIIDGSFITSKPNPSDIDIIVVVDSNIKIRNNSFKPYEYNAISSRMIRRMYRFDALVAPEGSRACERYKDHYSKIKEGDFEFPKGLVMLKIR